MISKTKIKLRLRRKTNLELAETIQFANKSPPWNALAQILSRSTKKYSSINLWDIEKQTSAGDTIIIPGKVLSSGEVTKKLRICALSISEKAKEKTQSIKIRICYN